MIQYSSSVPQFVPSYPPPPPAGGNFIAQSQAALVAPQQVSWPPGSGGVETHAVTKNCLKEFVWNEEGGNVSRGVWRLQMCEMNLSFILQMVNNGQKYEVNPPIFAGTTCAAACLHFHDPFPLPLLAR